MNKLLFIVLFGLNFSIFALSAPQDANSPKQAAEYIINTSIQNLVALNTKQEIVTNEQVIALINKKFVPFINTSFSASQTLKKQWSSLTPKQQDTLGNYIISSLITDYSSFLTNYKQIQEVSIVANPNVKQKDNKAIVALTITTPSKETIEIAVKMIYTNSWQIYDIIVFGVSLVKNYEQQFKSYIRRKGFDAFVKKFLT